MTQEPGSPNLELLAQVVELVPGSTGVAQFLGKSLAEACRLNRAIEFTCVVRGVKGAWRELAIHGKPVPLPEDLLADVLDQESTIARGLWTVSPFKSATTPGMLLVAHGTSPIAARVVEEMGAAIARCLPIVETGTEERQKSQRLAAMLEMTAQWNQSRETGELLQTMAETSTRLLDAERATIFLLDATGQRLVGRPALGIESGELVISVDTGVVGQVVQTGLARRVDEDIAAEQAEVDRVVGEQTGFVTRSLVCVPMFGPNRQTIGAFELLNKRGGNFSEADERALAELAAHAANAIVNTQHVEVLNSSRRTVADEAAGKVRMIGECPAIIALQKTVARVAETELAVLVLGENGTGKEVIAQLIHYLSPRRDHVMVAVNCAAITETLLESELFGHERGAFTDAHDTRQGKFELASGGTLFLDEIGDMSPGGQAKLLRVLEEKVVVRVGGSQPIPVDVRVIAATNQDLGQLVRDKKFREDLFFRLNVVTLQLPPLRERGDDILMLAESFLKDFCARARRPVPKLTAAARKALAGHNWPGNVRELRNMMERLAYLSTDERIDAGDLSFVTTPGKVTEGISMDLALTEATRLFQVDYIEKQIKRTRGNMTDAAQRLGLHRSNLYRKMKQLGIDGGDEMQ